MGTGGGLVVIDFSQQGNSAHFRAEGWSGQEPDRVWAIGPRSRLVVPIQSSGRPVGTEAELGPGEPSSICVGQIVRLRVNGIAIGGGVRVNTRTMICCEIDPALAAPSGVLNLDFEISGFHRPAVVLLAPPRLSGWFSFVRLYTLDMDPPGCGFRPVIRIFRWSRCRGRSPPRPTAPMSRPFMTSPRSIRRHCRLTKDGRRRRTH